VALGEGGPCNPPDVPPSYLPHAYAKNETFCVLQHPYDRMLAQFRQTFRGTLYRRIGCVDSFNTHLRRSLKQLRGTWKKDEAAQPYFAGCHFLPQAAYVFGWDAARKQVNTSQRWCTHTLRLENLQDDMNTLLGSHGLPGDFRTPPSGPVVCPMLSRWSMFHEARMLIEDIFQDDFRLFGYEKLVGPEFIHIPRTGGTTVEDVSQQYVLWGRRNPKLGGGPRWMGPSKIDTCYPQHVPPSNLVEVFGDRKTFCIVRDVHTRMISEFGYWAEPRFPSSPPKYACNASELNRFVTDRLEGRGGYRDKPHHSDCHLLPQSAFVYAWDKKKGTVDHSQTWCGSVIRFERLNAELNRYWDSFGYPMHLVNHRSWTKTRGPCATLTPKDFTEKSLGLIATTYRDDFDLIKKLDAAPPQAPPEQQGDKDAATNDVQPPIDRTLVYDERYVEQAMLAMDDVVTAAEFELSFDLTIHSKNDVTMTSVMRLTNTSGYYGSAGDRMPAILIGAGTTRLFTYMGKPDKPNNNCQSPEPGLALGKAARVKVRLEGDTCKVSIDGKESCVMRGYNQRYPGMANVMLWLGDSWNTAAHASVANFAYMAVGASRR